MTFKHSFLITTEENLTLSWSLLWKKTGLMIILLLIWGVKYDLDMFSSDSSSL